MAIKRSIVEDKISSMVEGLSTAEPTTIVAESKGGRGKDLAPRTRAKKALLREPEVPKSFTIPESLLKEVEQLAIDEGLRNFTQTMHFIIRKGLEACKKDGK